MNLVYGKIVSISIEGEMRIGKIRVGGAMKNISLDLVTEADVGDSVLLCDGVAIAKIENGTNTEVNYPRA
jgi:hydrogenase maturation factor